MKILTKMARFQITKNEQNMKSTLEFILFIMYLRNQWGTNVQILSAVTRLKKNGF